MSVTVTDPMLAARMANLRRANDARSRHVAVKRELAAGRMSVAEALEDERAQSMTVLAILVAQPKWGRSRAVRALRTPGQWPISESKPVRELTAHQRALICEACGPWHERR